MLCAGFGVDGIVDLTGVLTRTRSLLYVDADARMEVFTDAEGNKRSNLSLVARNFDVLSRARTEEGAETNDEGLVQEASG